MLLLACFPFLCQVNQRYFDVNCVCPSQRAIKLNSIPANQEPQPIRTYFIYLPLPIPHCVPLHRPYHLNNSLSFLLSFSSHSSGGIFGDAVSAAHARHRRGRGRNPGHTRRRNGHVKMSLQRAVGGERFLLLLGTLHRQQIRQCCHQGCPA